MFLDRAILPTLLGRYLPLRFRYSRNAKLYLQNEGVSSPLSLADGDTLQMAGDSGTDDVNMATDTLTFAGGEGLVSTVSDNNVSYAVDVSDFSTSMTGDLEDTDEFAISDGGTMKKVDFSVVRDAVLLMFLVMLQLLLVVL